MSEAEVRQIREGTDRAVLLSLDPTGTGQDSLAALVPDAAPRPDEALVAAERLGYLRDALAELPERQRFVVTEYYLDQRPLTEIAEQLGVTQSRASQLRAEGLDLLREALTTLLHPDARAGVGARTDARAEGARNPYHPTADDAPARDGVRARRRSAYVDAVANRSGIRERADVRAYLAGAALTAVSTDSPARPTTDFSRDPADGR
jgi:RNA polymerase sigma factor for flagellar operon FliA